MDTHRLRQFIAVAEELHFGRAALRLHQTQPPISMAVQALERELGVQLFERSRRHVALTSAGETFLLEARAIIKRTEDAMALTRAAGRGEVGRLAVGFLAATAYTLMPIVVRDFVRRYPGVHLDLQERTMPQMFEAFRREDIEVALMRPLETEVPLQFHTVMNEPMVAALPAGHPLGALKKIPGRRLANEPLVMFTRVSKTIFPDLVMNFFRDAGVTPRIAQEATQTHAVLGLVSAGLGVALVPESVRTIGMRGVIFRPLAANAPIVPTATACRPGDTSPLVREFVEVAKESARAMRNGAGRNA